MDLLDGFLDKIFEMKDLYTRAAQIDKYLLFEFLKETNLILDIENFLEGKIDKKIFSDYVNKKEKILREEIANTNDCKILLTKLNQHKWWNEKIKNFQDENGDS